MAPGISWNKNALAFNYLEKYVAEKENGLVISIKNYYK
jgi:hypothetical protein